METSILTPATPADVARAQQITPAKRSKMLAETLGAVAAMAAEHSRAIELAETLGADHPETLAQWQFVSTLGLTIGRRTRILGGLPRGG